MSFKLKSPYNVDWTPVYRTLNEDGVLGLANKNGTIRVHKDLKGKQLEDTIIHESVHCEDMKMVCFGMIMKICTIGKQKMILGQQ